jgi:hypothetical protein
MLPLGNVAGSHILDVHNSMLTRHAKHQQEPGTQKKYVFKSQGPAVRPNEVH